MFRGLLAGLVLAASITQASAQKTDFLPVRSVKCYSGENKVYEGVNVGVTANPAIMPGPGTTLVVKERNGTFTIIHGANAICVMNWKPNAVKPASPQR